MDLLDSSSRKAIVEALRTSNRLGHTQVTHIHVLIGILSDQTPASRALTSFGLTATAVASHADSTDAPIRDGEAQMSNSLRDVITWAAAEARRHDVLVDAGLLTRGVLNANDPLVEAVLAAAHTSKKAVLAALDATVPTVEQVDAVFDQERDARHAGDRAAEPKAPSNALPADLAKYGRDLVEDARNGSLTPVHGRARELNRVQVILGRRTKNNPVLIGEAGVGKTAVVEGLAHAIANGRCVEALRGRPLVALDVASMLAGARNRGDFEERLKKVVAAAQKINAIVFIDEIHQIVGAGAAGGAMDAANLLKENLARGQFTLVGATTLDEYRKHIESDAALERRLEPVRIDAPSVPDTIEILRTLKVPFASHHNVVYTDEAVTAAARLTDKHVPDRQLPDKAIDALDEAGAAASIAIMRTSAELGALYKDRAKARTALAAAVREERYEDAGPFAKKDRALTAEILEHDGVDLAVVDEHAVARIVAMTAGVPVGAIAMGEQDLLRTLDERLSARVIGQASAVATVTSVVRRRRCLGSERPAALMFAGPTGVGKTELAVALADILFSDGTGAQDRGALIRIDMSEFAEKHTVSRLVGAPPGYVGHEEGGELTEAVRRNPHAVVLLDEVEKAHPDVFDLLLQVFEDGRLTDGAGRAVSFKDTIVILTSNLGSSAGGNRAPIGFATTNTEHLAAAAHSKVIDAVKGHFRPEFINRLDQIVVFDPLSKHDLTAIVANMLDRPLRQLAEKGISVHLADAALDLLLAAGFDPTMGARPLRRAIARLLENPLADAIVAGTLPAGSVAYVDVSSDGTALTVLPSLPEEAVVQVAAAAM